MKRILTILALAGGTCLLGTTVGANTITELGTVTPGTPASPSDETGYLTQLINMYNNGTPASPFSSGNKTYTLNVGSAVPPPSLPAPGVNNGQVVSGNGPQTGLMINLGANSYNYVMVKWGQDDEFYYIGGLTGTITLNNDVNGNGESHYDLFGGTPRQVPDGGTTILLFGAALSGLGLLRRKLS